MEPWHHSKTHLPTSAARWRKPDPDGPKRCHFSSILTAALFSACRKWRRKGLKSWETGWFASSEFILYLFQLHELSVQLQRKQTNVCVCGGGGDLRRGSWLPQMLRLIPPFIEKVVPKSLKVRWRELSEPWKSGFRRMLFSTCNKAIGWHIYVCASPETRGSAE